MRRVLRITQLDRDGQPVGDSVALIVDASTVHFDWSFVEPDGNAVHITDRLADHIVSTQLPLAPG